MAAKEHSSVIAAAAALYFSGVHTGARGPRWLRPILSKESAVGVLFVSGCAAPAFAGLRSPGDSGLVPLLTCTGVFALLAWLNCAAIDSWESGAVAQEAISNSALIICALGLVLAFALWPRRPHPALLLCTASASALLLDQLNRWRTWIEPVSLRALADLVLLLPAAMVLREVWSR